MPALWLWCQDILITIFVISLICLFALILLICIVFLIVLSLLIHTASKDPPGKEPKRETDITFLKVQNIPLRCTKDILKSFFK